MDYYTTAYRPPNDLHCVGWGVKLYSILGDSVSAFRVKLGANDLNCVDVPLNPTHSVTHCAYTRMNGQAELAHQL